MTEEIPGLPAPDLTIELRPAPKDIEKIVDPIGYAKKLAEAKAIKPARFSERFVTRNIDLESLGLELIKYEYETDAGFIDILCQDSNGGLVAVEVKKGIAQAATIGQLLGYMSMLSCDCHGMIIAAGFSERLVRAANRVGISLMRYGLRVVVEPYIQDTKNDSSKGFSYHK